MAELTIGQRIRLVRQQRGLSIRQASGLAGIADSTLSRIERGERSADNRHMLADIARALRCSVADLTGEPTAVEDRTAGRVAGQVHETLQALLDTDLDLPATVRDPWPVDQLAAGVLAVQEACLSCRYADAVAQLAPLLRHAHARVHGPDRDDALHALSGAARWAMVTLKCLGHSSQAWIAAERSHDAARALGDPIVIGVAAWSRGHAATSCGAYARGVAVALAGIDALRDEATPRAVQVSGSLHLLAGGDALIREADRLARTVGDTDAEGDPHGLVFGVPNVTLWRLSAAVEAGDPGLAVELGRSDELVGSLQRGTLPISRQGALYLDLARALADSGDTGRAIRTILRAERVAPERIRTSAIARETVRGLVAARRQETDRALGGLAERLHITQ